MTVVHFSALSMTDFLNKLQMLLLIQLRVNFSSATLAVFTPLLKKKKKNQKSILLLDQTVI